MNDLCITFFFLYFIIIVVFFFLFIFITMNINERGRTNWWLAWGGRDMERSTKNLRFGVSGGDDGTAAADSAVFLSAVVFLYIYIFCICTTSINSFCYKPKLNYRFIGLYTCVSYAFGFATRPVYSYPPEKRTHQLSKLK